ncbi:TIGR03619 family F420-dependent LLM class oxidoreductase [Streptacidiphilus sp. EB129]|uniref:TIGR03619 family F420-dependent LLM class oxidoreductase n=1 Tax=Streptacidiphilus sp. EB129 TaxID=3156262 RepID=UPI0035154275
MRIGLALPQYGVFADPEATVTVATAAEAAGFDSLWAADRILAPLAPRDSYGGTGRPMPEEFRVFLDPLTLLTLAASVTTRVRLGTSTLNALWTPPVMLARTLTTLDLISRGRLDVGIGLGWSRDEYQSVSVPWEGRGKRLDETLDLLETLWTAPTIEHHGAHWTVPASTVEPKPAQSPRPPLLLAGLTPAAIARVGRRADGWLAVGVPLPVLGTMWQGARRAAEEAGRDPEALRGVLRLNPHVTRDPAPAEAVPTNGTVAQIAGYVHAAEALGLHEVLLDLQQTGLSSSSQLLDLAGELKAAIG